VSGQHTQSEAEGLSKRQAQCLALASQGLTSKEIAREIGISPSTVDNHLRVAAAKLQAPNRRAAVRRANAFKNPPEFATEADRSIRRSARKLGLLPPIGGLPNNLSAVKRLMLVVRIALVGTMALAAITTTISGIVAILSS
jgi:DNA-binding CsgD family transcriptional regulator